MRSSASGPLVRLFLDDATDGLPAGDGIAGAGDDRVLSIEELARQFNVSTKTISRWRDHGLVAQRHDVGGR